ncbi:MAG: hypothetical protein HQL31_04690 [Planctomycetes bacterium]|nr:hypothetical protein [Planctomycetota bacterium]
MKDDERIDWAGFLARCDLRWDEGVRDQWGESAFIADGQTGASIYGMPEEPGALRWELGRTDLTAQSRLPVEWCVPRVPLGNTVLRPSGRVNGSSMRLRLWNAEATGEIKTSTGGLQWRSLVEREARVLVIELDTEDGEHEATLEFCEQYPISFQALSHGIDFTALPPDQRPPQPRREQVGEVSVVVQPLTSHGAHATAWLIERPSPGRRIMYLAVRTCHLSELPREKAAQDASAAAIAAGRKAQATGWEALVARHREWWHAYLRQAYVALPHDPQWEQFYWVQIYKFGCASRADVPIIIDNLGPWYTECQWAGTWWNLNVQLSYYPTFSANRLDAGRSQVSALDHYFKTGSMCVPGNPSAITMDRTSSYDGKGGVSFEIGNLTWALHNYWRYWKYSMDEAVGRQLARILKADVNFYLSVLIERDGRLHIPVSASPEYPGGPWEDTSYSHQLLRWALGTLLELDQHFELKDPMVACWRDTLDRLIDLPINEHGLMVAVGQGFDTSHRHYSHLLALYPLHAIRPDEDPESEALFRKSLERWCSMKTAWAGYSCTGSAAMFATLGEGNRALEQLDMLRQYGMLQPNTMYAESGGPVIETPLSVVETINYMMLQSWGDVIRIFPAMPDRWPEATFNNLRAEGAFLVSAEWHQGRMAWIKIHSLVGSPCRVETGTEDFDVEGERVFQVDILPGPVKRKRLDIDLRKGETVWLRHKGKGAH